MPATRSNAFISSPPSRPQRLKEQEQGQHGSRAVEDICRVNLRAVSCDLTPEHVREDVHNSGRGYQPDDGCRDLPEHSSITSFRVAALIHLCTLRRPNNRQADGIPPGQEASLVPGQLARCRLRRTQVARQPGCSANGTIKHITKFDSLPYVC